MKARRAALYTVAAGALVVALVWSSGRDAPRPAGPAPLEAPGAGPLASGSAPAAAAAPGSAADAWLVRYGIPAASRGPMPASLAGTSVDGDLRVDREGRFVPGPETLVLFDYFFSASGEEDPAVVRGRIALHALEALPEPAAREVIDVLDRYVRYREAARELAKGDVAASDLSRRLQWMRELRAETLGPELTQAFYGEEEAVAILDVRRLEIAQDPTLDDDVRERLLRDVEESLPPDVQEQRRRAAGPSVLRREVLDLRASGASEDEVFAAREERYGEDAARRLAALDEQRADWQRRVSAYRVERDALEREGLSAPEQQARLDAVRARLFSPDELPRVAGLDLSDSR